MGFTLQKEMVKDFVAHAFHNKMINEEFMMKEFTPFAFNSWMKKVK